MVETAVEVGEILKDLNFSASIINVRFVKPIDEEMLEEVARNHTIVVPMEEGVQSGGFGEAVKAWYQNREGLAVCPVALPNQFIEHGSVDLLKKKYGLDAESIAEKVICNRLKSI